MQFFVPFSIQEVNGWIDIDQIFTKPVNQAKIDALKVVLKKCHILEKTHPKNHCLII